MSASFNLVGQGWPQLGELAFAFVLSAAVGLEREVRQKSAGLRTYSLVGVSAALFMLISKYGFMNVLVGGQIVVDPSRVAAQIVSGIGFIGGGVIFMRRDVVRGLTTAASVWLTAALGMACGAGLPVLATATTLGYFLIMFAYPRLVRRFLPLASVSGARVVIEYEDRERLPEDILALCAGLRFSVENVEIERRGGGSASDNNRQDPAEREAQETAGRGTGIATLTMQVKGIQPVALLIARLSALAGIVRAGSSNADGPLE